MVSLAAPENSGEAGKRWGGEKITTYLYAGKGRALRAIVVAAFLGTLAASFLWAASPASIVIEVISAVLGFGGLYALLKSEAWSIRIQDNVLSWSYGPWPRSSGSVDLNTERRIVVSDYCGKLSFTFRDGTTRTIRLIGGSDRLQKDLRDSLSHLKVELVTEVIGCRSSQPRAVPRVA